MDQFTILSALLLTFVQAQDGKPPPSLMIDPPKSILKSFALSSGLNSHLDQPQPSITLKLGVHCRDNFTCSAIPNSHCVNESCRCLPSFYEDPRIAGSCRLAPGYSEHCAPKVKSLLGPTVQCREPYTCNNTGLCDCPEGFIQEYFQCVRDCPNGQVPIGKECHTARLIGEKCQVNEQCIQSYAQCLHHQCQCIPGANQYSGSCYPVNQCPLGDPVRNEQGKIIPCKTDTTDNCPKDHYCLFAEFTDAKGFCCPKIKMNCPIGKPLQDRNCSNCPWETHHCFSYVIGTYTETMCCPNACPTSQPIQKNGRCYARSAFGGHCSIDEQCYNVAGAKCRHDEDERKRCICPKGNWRNYFGRCLRESNLGENCTRDEECKVGTNTICDNGVCTCYAGYMPEPQTDPQTISSKCIAEPSCPTATGIHSVQGSYKQCKQDDDNSCEKTEFCRKWWFDGNKTFSLCCPKPGLKDYESICSPFRMALILANKVHNMKSDKNNNRVRFQDAEPLRCDISPFPQQILLHESTDNVTIPLKMCPAGSSCLFDPFATNQGVCCRPKFDDEADVKAAKPEIISKSTDQKTVAKSAVRLPGRRRTGAV